MKKRILSILLLCCMVLTMLPTAAFAAVSDSLGNTPKENQAILEQLSALTGGSSVSTMQHSSRMLRIRFFMSFFPPVRVGSAYPPRLFSDFLFF